MKSHGRRAVRALLPTFLLALTALTAAPAPQRPAAIPAAAGEQLSAVRAETRLRKLHLVRPDLIPYPIAFEVYC